MSGTVGFVIGFTKIQNAFLFLISEIECSIDAIIYHYMKLQLVTISICIGL